jgi:hypothetical protein
MVTGQEHILHCNYQPNSLCSIRTVPLFDSYLFGALLPVTPLPVVLLPASRLHTVHLDYTSTLSRCTGFCIFDPAA